MSNRRARGSLHDLVHLPEIEDAGIGLGVDLLDRRHQHEVGSGLGEQPLVGFGGSGVVAQVVLVIELRRIHEDAHHHGGILPAGAFDERAVAGVERAHRRHEADSRLLRPVELRAKLPDVGKYFHPCA